MTRPYGYGTPKSQEVQTLREHTDLVKAVAFSPDGSMLASASSGHNVRLWNPQTDQKLQTLKAHTNELKSVAFSRDGSLITFSHGYIVQLWNPRTGEELQRLDGVASFSQIFSMIDNESPFGHSVHRSIMSSSGVDNTPVLNHDWTEQGGRRASGSHKSTAAICQLPMATC